MRLLITGAWNGASAHLPELQALGHEVRFLQQEREALPCDPTWVEGVVCNGLFLYHPLADFPSLRYIQLTSAGYDRVDPEQIRARGIALRNARGVYSVPMAEFALSGVLQLYKRAACFRAAQQACRWEKRRDLLELAGKTVTILGCGSVGSACAKRFAAFDCRVLGVDLFPVADPSFAEVFTLAGEEDALSRLLPQTDILLLTLPLTPQTRGLIGAARLAQLKPGAILVNIARGAVADEAAVIAALDRGTLSGAVLDVFETEPLPPDSPLWARENVILTPHNSFVGEGNPDRLWSVIHTNLSALPGEFAASRPVESSR